MLVRVYVPLERSQVVGAGEPSIVRAERCLGAAQAEVWLPLEELAALGVLSRVPVVVAKKDRCRHALSWPRAADVLTVSSSKRSAQRSSRGQRV